MRRSGQCPKCGGREVVARVRTVSHISNEESELEVEGLGEGERAFRVKIAAWVCSACGYLEQYALTPEVLRRPEQPERAGGEAEPIASRFVPAGVQDDGGRIGQEAAEALRAGDLVRAVKVVRDARSLGLKEAKDLVDAHVAAHPELRGRLGAARSEARRGCLVSLALVALAVAGAIALWRHFG